MTFSTARLLEVFQMGETIAGFFDLHENALPKPGQYLPSQHIDGELEIQYHPLFNVVGPADHICLGPIPSRWQPGDRVACLPPQGNGFHLPGSAQRVGLLALDNPPIRTLPLIQQALEQNAAVALFFQSPPNPELLRWIPSSVEISPLSLLLEDLDWPDFLAVEVARENLEKLTSLLGEGSKAFSGQILVNKTMPCRGLGECGVCAVKTRNGRRLACTDGPVFPLKELLHVAG